MPLNRVNIIYTAIAALLVMVAGLFIAITSVFWISFYLILLLIMKFRSRNKVHYRFITKE